MARKKFEQLNLQDAFLFSAALEDPDTCRLILELFLGYPINNITVHAEHSILLTSDFKSVRLDIYASDKIKVGYNLDYSDFRFIPINRFESRILTYSEQVYRNNSFSSLAQADR